MIEEACGGATEWNPLSASDSDDEDVQLAVPPASDSDDEDVPLAVVAARRGGGIAHNLRNPVNPFVYILY